MRFDLPRVNLFDLAEIMLRMKLPTPSSLLTQCGYCHGSGRHIELDMKVLHHLAITGRGQYFMAARKYCPTCSGSGRMPYGIGS